MEQPMPTEGRQSVTDELIAFLRERQAKGITTYGRSLETFNGRDARRDALEEAIDLNQYLFQMYLEEKAERERLAIEINMLRGIVNLYEAKEDQEYPASQETARLLDQKIREWRNAIKE